MVICVFNGLCLVFSSFFYWYRLGVMYHNLQYLKYIVDHWHKSFILRILMWYWITMINICDKFNGHTPHTMIRQIRLWSKGLCYFSHLLYFFTHLLTRNGNGIETVLIRFVNRIFIVIDFCLNFMFVVCNIGKILHWEQFQWLNDGKISFILCGFYINQPYHNCERKSNGIADHFIICRHQFAVSSAIFQN